MKHGGLYTLLDANMMSARLTPLMASTGKLTDPQIQAAVVNIQSTVESFFYRLCQKKGYTVHFDLMSFITIPHDGVSYEDKEHPNKNIPAVFTFVGQFIDHDLTMNAVNLTMDQTGAVLDNASPIIDLDNVYGPRTKLNNAAGMNIFDNEGHFKLRRIDKNAYDLPRAPKDMDGLEKAYIIDARNDDNQLILQIHILLMRVHNKLVDEMAAHGHSPTNVDDIVAAVREKVVANWQSVVLHDYMPRTIENSTLDYVLREIAEPDYGNLKHKPYRDLVKHENVVRMPHEFAIGFRFGHSQLRREYTLNEHPPVLLFNNRKEQFRDDLQGARLLAADHVVDWDIFFPPEDQEVPPDKHQSLLIDGLAGC